MTAKRKNAMKDMIEKPLAGTWNGIRIRTLLAAADTGGRIGVVDTVNPPRSCPPMHIHHAEDEVLLVLSGDIEVALGSARLIVGPGQAAFVPRGTEHTFRVVSAVPSRVIAILTPGGFEGFFADMVDGQYRIPEDMPAIIESGARHRLSFTGPPLGDAAV
jgi:mannose-6-phosphate isomerase-like protein (cupin superfamily)